MENTKEEKSTALLENAKENKKTTLLDLNLYDMDEIFKAIKQKDDKLNLAMTHSFLAAAFGFHHRQQLKKLLVNRFSCKHLKFILKNYGEHVEYMKLYFNIKIEQLQLIVDNCSNMKKLRVNDLKIVESEEETHSKLAKLPLRKLYLRYDSGTLIELIRECKTLRGLKLYKSQTIDINFITTLLDILDANEVTPDEPFSLVLQKKFTKLDENLLAEISLCDKSNLLNIEILGNDFYDTDNDSDDEYVNWNGNQCDDCYCDQYGNHNDNECYFYSDNSLSDYSDYSLSDHSDNNLSD